MPWGKKWPVQMNLPFFAVKACVPGGVQNQAEKNSKSAFRPVPVQKFTFRWEGGDGPCGNRHLQKLEGWRPMPTT